MASRTPFSNSWRRLASRLARPSAASSPSSFVNRPLRQHRLISSQPPRKTNQVKFWPFLVIVGLGTVGYLQLVKQRIEMTPPADKPAGELAAPAKPVPAFSPDNVTVVFVLGGPGAGKGTQCANLVSQYGFIHLSAGDLLRAEQDRPGSQFGDLIRDYIKNGLIVPMEVTIQLLENAMTEALQKSGSNKGRFLIDGFPRKLDQAHKFEEAVCPAKLVLFYDCPEKVMESRLLERGKTSGRADDNADSIRKRFKTFIETSMPVVDEFEKQGKVVKIDATPSPADVFKTTQKRLTEKLGPEF